MRATGTAIFLLLLCFAPRVHAEERPISDLGKTLVLERDGPGASDAILLDVRLRDDSTGGSVRFPRLVGPIWVSPENRQVFSCESNAIMATGAALGFDLSGRRAFAFQHRGFLRDCGLTEDRRLYWLIYNVAVGGETKNSVVVLDEAGRVVASAMFAGERSFEFSVGGRPYVLPVAQAELPG